MFSHLLCCLALTTLRLRGIPAISIAGGVFVAGCISLRRLEQRVTVVWLHGVTVGLWLSVQLLYMRSLTCWFGPM